MATIGDGLFARLTGDAAIGDALGTRVYPRVRPQGSALPAAVYSLPGSRREEHLKGYNGSQRPRVRLDFYATSWAQARALAELAIALLAQPGTAGGIAFGHAAADEPRDLGEPVQGGGYIHRASVDLLVEYRLA